MSSPPPPPPPPPPAMPGVGGSSSPPPPPPPAPVSPGAGGSPAQPLSSPPMMEADDAAVPASPPPFEDADDAAVPASPPPFEDADDDAVPASPPPFEDADEAPEPEPEVPNVAAEEPEVEAPAVVVADVEEEEEQEVLAEKPVEPEHEPEHEPEPEPEPEPVPVLEAAPEPAVISEPEGLTVGPDDVAATAAAQEKIDDEKDALDAAIDAALAPEEAVAPEAPEVPVAAAQVPPTPVVVPAMSAAPAAAEDTQEIMPGHDRELTAADADIFGKGLDKMKDEDIAKNRELTLEQARKYLSLTVAPTLKAGIKKVAVEQPADPVEFMAKFLEMHHPDPALKPVIFVFGARSSGKDVCCERIAKEFGWTWVQAGDVLRAEVEGKSAEGKAITECIQKGQTVPSDMTIRLLKKTFEHVTGPGVLLDGFPRKIDQAGLFEKEMPGFRGAIHFHVRKEIAMERMMAGIRKYTTFDPKERFEKRWKTYVHHTGPILEYYKSSGQLTEVNASRHPEDVFAEIRPMFAPIFKV